MQREFSYSQLQSSKVYFKLENLSYCISNVTNENNSTKVLGLVWNIKHDTLELNFQEHMLLIQDPPTKLLLIKYFNSLHDSLRLLNLYIVRLKKKSQKVCKVGIS